MPFARLIIFGVVTAVLLGCASVLLGVGEMAGPADFRVLLILSITTNSLSAAFIKPRGWWRGFLAGLVFAVPVIATCLAIPTLMYGSTTDPSVNRHARELRFVGISTAVIAVVMFGLRGVDRRRLTHETSA